MAEKDAFLCGRKMVAIISEAATRLDPSPPHHSSPLLPAVLFSSFPTPHDVSMHRLM